MWICCEGIQPNQAPICDHKTDPVNSALKRSEKNGAPRWQEYSFGRERLIQGSVWSQRYRCTDIIDWNGASARQQAPISFPETWARTPLQRGSEINVDASQMRTFQRRNVDLYQSGRRMGLTKIIRGVNRQLKLRSSKLAARAGLREATKIESFFLKSGW